MHTLIAIKDVLQESQIEGLRIGPQTITGALILDDDEKVVIYPSEWLSCLTETQAIAFSSAKTYARNMTYFLKFLRSRQEFFGLTLDESLLQVKRSVIEDWLIRLGEVEGLDRATVRNRESCIRSFYEFVTDGERRDPILDKTPFPEYYISPKPHKKQVVSASLTDLVALMNECRFERERLLFQFMYDAGVRISEVERVTCGDIQEAINFTKSPFTGSDKLNKPVRPGYAPILIRGSKGRRNSIKERYAIITTATLKRIAAYHASPLYKRYQVKSQDRMSFPAFLNTKGNPYNEDSLEKLIERRSKSALRKRLITKSVHAHLFRHGSAYLTLEDPDLGQDFLDRLVNVQKTLGHASITTTESYTSIPHDIYNSIADSEMGSLKTKIDKMAEVVEHTKLRIRIGDRK